MTGNREDDAENAGRAGIVNACPAGHGMDRFASAKSLTNAINNMKPIGGGQWAIN